MRAIKRILVATDHSEAADEAIRQAHAWALDREAELVVCHVIPNPMRSTMLFPQLQQQMVEDHFKPEPAEEAISALVSRLTGRAEQDFGVIVADGDPHAVIVQQAEACEADLIVVGGQGASALSRLFLGSVAERVVRYAHTPVLVARPGEPSGRILVATDFSDPALPAMEAAADETRRRKARLTALHAIWFGIPFPMRMGASLGMNAVSWPALSEDVMGPLRDAAASRLRASLRQFDADGEALIVEGDAVSSIIRQAEAMPAELVVVGTTGRTGLKRLTLGSVAEGVVRNTSCSVLVVRLEHRQAK